MNLRQLRFIQEVARNGFSISQAAESLYATQPGVSLQIKQLEDELGVKIFQRYGKRIVGITPAGEAIIKLAETTLLNIKEMKNIGEEFSESEQGTLTIATTHTQARYALPNVIAKFRQQNPGIQLRIRQGSPTQISEMVIQGEADFAIATESIYQYKELAVLPVYRWNRCVLTPPRHPLLKATPLTLEKIAEYPLITYDFAFTGRSLINETFSRLNLSPNIVITAIDSDVIKRYVELGLGIGIVANMAFDAKIDKKLRSLDASHLFKESVTSIGIRRGRYMRSFMYAFIELFAPALTRKKVDQTIANA